MEEPSAKRIWHLEQQCKDLEKAQEELRQEMGHFERAQEILETEANKLADERRSAQKGNLIFGVTVVGFVSLVFLFVQFLQSQQIRRSHEIIEKEVASALTEENLARKGLERFEAGLEDEHKEIFFATYLASQVNLKHYLTADANLLMHQEIIDPGQRYVIALENDYLLKKYSKKLVDKKFTVHRAKALTVLSNAISELVRKNFREAREFCNYAEKVDPDFPEAPFFYARIITFEGAEILDLKSSLETDLEEIEVKLERKQKLEDEERQLEEELKKAKTKAGKQTLEDEIRGLEGEIEIESERKPILEDEKRKLKREIASVERKLKDLKVQKFEALQRAKSKAEKKEENSFYGPLPTLETMLLVERGGAGDLDRAQKAIEKEFEQAKHGIENTMPLTLVLMRIGYVHRQLYRHWDTVYEKREEQRLPTDEYREKAREHLTPLKEYHWEAFQADLNNHVAANQWAWYTIDYGKHVREPIEEHLAELSDRDIERLEEVEMRWRSGSPTLQDSSILDTKAHVHWALAIHYRARGERGLASEKESNLEKANEQIRDAIDTAMKTAELAVLDGKKGLAKGSRERAEKWSETAEEWAKGAAPPAQQSPGI